MLQSMGSQRVGHDLATEQQHVLLCLPGCSVVKDPPANAGDTGWIPGLGKSPREGNGNPLQYSCLENPMGGGTYQVTIHEIAKNQTQLGIEHIHYDMDQK